VTHDSQYQCKKRHIKCGGNGELSDEMKEIIKYTHIGIVFILIKGHHTHFQSLKVSWIGFRLKWQYFSCFPYKKIFPIPKCGKSINKSQ